MTTWLKRLTRCIALLLGLALGGGALVGLTACGPGTTTAGNSATRNATRATGNETDPASGLTWINASRLPREARHTLDEIAAGGPWDYPRNDNVVYHNNNRVLPQHPDGYYREYTVRTPGRTSRGTRRIIKGQGGELYYTADHYTTFHRIREGQ